MPSSPVLVSDSVWNKAESTRATFFTQYCVSNISRAIFSCLSRNIARLRAILQHSEQHCGIEIFIWPVKKILRYCSNIQPSEGVPVGEKAERARKLHQIKLRNDSPMLRDVEPELRSEMRVCLA